jgi:hypothetical protein
MMHARYDSVSTHENAAIQAISVRGLSENQQDLRVKKVGERLDD